MPRTYAAEVSFSDSRGKHVDAYRFVLDWETLIARTAVTRYGIHHVADALQDISSAVRRVTTGDGSITVQSFDREAQRKRASRIRRRRDRRFRVAGNSDDPPNMLDRVLVLAEKASVRLRSLLGF